MVERTAALCRQLGAEQGSEELIATLSRAVCERLAGELRRGVTPDDCGEAFPLAAALLVLQLLEQGRGAEAVTAFSVGEISLKKQQGGSNRNRAAAGLLAPWLRPSLAVRGVEG